MLAVTATVDVSSWSVRLTADGGVAPYEWTATPGDGRPSYVVRTSQAPFAGGTANGRAGIDGDAPFGVPIAYTATSVNGDSGAAAGTVTLSPPGPMLADATDPTRALAVVVAYQPPNEWVGRSVTFDVLDRPDPFVALAPMRLRDGELGLLVEDRADRAALRALLATGNPLVLRSTDPDTVDDQVMLVKTATERLVLDAKPAGSRLFALAYQSVTRELGPYGGNPGRTYMALLIESATYADLLLDFPTYADLLTGPVSVTLGAELIPGTTFGGASKWTEFWSDAAATLAVAGGVGTYSAPAGQIGRFEPIPPAIYGNPGDRFRISVQARRTAGVPVLELVGLTNTTDAGAEWMGAGVGLQVRSAIALTGAMTVYALDVTMPAGHHYLRPSFGLSGPAVACAAELDNASCKAWV